MDLLIPNSWLHKFLDTKATPSELAKYLSLCGPSIERIKKTLPAQASSRLHNYVP